MPKHKVHLYVDRTVLGKAHPKVHKALDAPIKLLGKKHRVVFHSLPEAFAIGALAESSFEGGFAGVLHVITDTQTTKHKPLKETLDQLTELNSQTKKTRNRPKKKRKESERNIDRKKNHPQQTQTFSV
jgi:hypothetical protein